MICCFGKIYILVMVDGFWGDIWEIVIWRYDGVFVFEGYYVFYFGDEEEGVVVKVIVWENVICIKILLKVVWVEVILEQKCYEVFYIIDGDDFLWWIVDDEFQFQIVLFELE